MENPLSPASVQQRAAQFGGTLPPGAVIFTPDYEENFESEAFPSMNGLVKLHFPRGRDELMIARLMGGESNSMESRAFRTLEICLEAAPASWYALPNPNTGETKPVLAILDLPDVNALYALFFRFLKWRDSFRGGVPFPDAGTPQ